MNNQPGTQLAPKRLIAIMALTVIVILVSTVWLLYEASFNQQRQRLVEIAKARAGLVEAIVNHDENHQHSHDGDVGASVLKLVQLAYMKFRGFGESGEFTLARLNDDNIEFLLGYRHNVLEQPEPVPVSSTLAEPMRRALQGKSGTLVGIDYRSVEVLAAYETINMLGWGVVAKINMSEIREPFIKAALISILIAILVIALGSMFTLRFMSPLITQIGDDHFYLRTLFQNSPIGLALCRMDGTLVETNTAYSNITGYSLKEANDLSYWDITPDRYRDMEAEQLWHLEHRGGYGPYEKEYIHKEGHLVPVRLKGKIINRGGEDFIWSSVEDISDRVEAERRLRQAATIFESTGEGIIITDENNKIILVNSAY
ncbi:MAG: PAS domain S-box protein, partial [Gammaproteobacteria bacterium]|nr:PAS domain S-box protein [Gammaproteobacteria bacterium]